MNDFMPILKKGDTIRIISTARKINPNELTDAIAFIKQNDFNPTLGENLYQSDNQFAGDDDERFIDLQNAINDPNLKAIWMARGGYGTHRIIDRINIDALKKRPKWIIGYSDVSVLHCYLNTEGIETLHATMPINFKDQSLESFEGIIEILKGKTPEYSIKAHHLNQFGSVSGKLFGGNLSILYSLTGTKLIPELKNSILFFEDLDEYLYHIDRIMMNLKLSGVLKTISGLIVGALSDMNDNDIPFGKTAEEIVSEHIKEYNIPVCFGFPAGHQYSNLPLIFGKEINLDVSAESSKISY